MSDKHFNILAKLCCTALLVIAFMPFVFAYTPDGSLNVLAQPLNSAPVASFTYTHDGYNISFTDTSIDNSGTIVAWNWSFGDGNYSDEQNPVHTYGAYDYYDVTLNVTDNEGLYDNMTRIVQVYAITEEEWFDVGVLELILLIVIAMFTMVVGLIAKTVGFRLVLFIMASLFFFIGAALFQTPVIMICMGIFGVVSAFFGLVEYTKVRNG